MTLVRKKIAECMFKRRKKSGFTQAVLSKKLKVSQSSISKFEKGLLEPSLSEWLRFCKVTKTALRPF